MNDVKLNDLLLMWLPQFQSMQGKAQSQSTAAAVDKVKAIVKQAVTDYATKASAIDSNPRLTPEAKAHAKGAAALDAQEALQSADMLVNTIAMEIQANDDEPLPPPKSSGNAVVDELRAQEIRVAFAGYDNGQFQAVYKQAMMDGDAEAVAAFENANKTAFPRLAVTPALREQALRDRLAAGADDEAKEDAALRDIHAQLTAVLGDAKRFLGIDLLAQQAAGIGPGVAGFTRGNGQAPQLNA